MSTDWFPCLLSFAGLFLSTIGSTAERKMTTAQGGSLTRKNSIEQQMGDANMHTGEAVVDGFLQSSSWGLSDDDLMASLSSFTAKLGDSLLAEQRQLQDSDLQNFNHNTSQYQHQNQNQTLHRNLDLSIDQIGGVPMTTFDIQMPVFSPPSLERSPTTSAESLSPSPWIPWLHDNDPLLQRTVNPETIRPDIIPIPRADGKVPSISQGLLIQGTGQSMTTKHLDVSGANPYMQYLQAIHPSQLKALTSAQAGYGPSAMLMSDHKPSFVDPQWQATMMAMMMDQNPAPEPRHGEQAHAQPH